MKVKRFVAANMRRALDLVKQEMGPDAVILSTSRTKEGVEVITSLTAPDQQNSLPKNDINNLGLSYNQPEPTARTGLSGLTRGLGLGRKNPLPANSHSYSEDVPMQSDRSWGDTITSSQRRRTQGQQSAVGFDPHSSMETAASAPINRQLPQEFEADECTNMAQPSSIAHQEDDFERTLRAHKNLQAAMKDFEQAYTFVQDAKAPDATVANAIKNDENKNKNEANEENNFVENTRSIKPASFVAQPLSNPAAQESAEPLDVQPAQEAEPEINVLAESENLAVIENSQGRDNAKEEEKREHEEEQSISSWWNSAFKFGSYQMNYNPEYQLYIEEDSEKFSQETEDTSSAITAQMIQLQSELEDLKENLQKNDQEEQKKEEEQVQSLEILPFRENQDVARALDIDSVADVKSGTNINRPMFTLVESPIQEDLPKEPSKSFPEGFEQTDHHSDNGQLESLKDEIADMRELLQTQLDRLTNVSTSQNNAIITGITPLNTLPPVKATVKRRLQHIGLAEEECDKLLSKINKQTALNEAWTEALAILAHQLPVHNRDMIDKGGFFAFVGSPGCGKTTAISKLAAHYVLQHGAKNVAIVSIASPNLPGNDSLQRLGQILKIPVHLVSDIKHLGFQLDELCEQKLVLIDTASFRFGDPQLKQQLSVLRQLPQVQNILVLASNTQMQLMKASVHAFRAADLHACVLSKMDDTVSLGEAFTTVLQEALPISYTTSSQDISKDVHVARSHQIVARAVSLLKTESKRQRRLMVGSDKLSALS